jgi:hypothetical protein
VRDTRLPDPSSTRIQRSAWARRLKIGLASCIIVAVTGAYHFFGLGHWRYNRVQADATKILGAPRSFEGTAPKPVWISPTFPSQLTVPCSPAELAVIMGKLQPSESEDVMSASTCLHVLSVFGLAAEFSGKKIASGQALLDLFVDDERGKSYFGKSPLRKTSYGVRPVDLGRNGPSTESHCDQTLAMLGQLGVPTSQPIKIDGKQFSLRDVLSDSIACFELRQREIEWTSVAYALYLSPSRVWRNKFGQQFSFDQLAEELMRREFWKSSCCGCHIVQAIIVLLRVDGQVDGGILSGKTRERMNQWLHDVVTSTVAAQDVDGSWGHDWYAALKHDSIKSESWIADKPSLHLRLVATSHIAHWMLYLPPNTTVPPDVLRRAAGWMQLQLRDADADFVRDCFCPCSHAASVLKVLSLR